MEINLIGSKCTPVDVILVLFEKPPVVQILKKVLIFYPKICQRVHKSFTLFLILSQMMPSLSKLVLLN
jgi:hypothetical protein